MTKTFRSLFTLIRFFTVFPFFLSSYGAKLPHFAPFHPHGIIRDELLQFLKLFAFLIREKVTQSHGETIQAVECLEGFP
jgi:hypothetical protein